MSYEHEDVGLISLWCSETGSKGNFKSGENSKNASVELSEYIWILPFFHPFKPHPVRQSIYFLGQNSKLAVPPT